MHLFDAPHRAFFLAGLAQALLALALWSLWLAGAFAGAYSLPLLPVSAIALHGFFMVYGIFPFFIFGFLMTTYPRWMQTEALSRTAYRGPVMLRVAGLAMTYLGLALGRAELAWGPVVMALADAWLAQNLFRVYHRARSEARRGIMLFNVTIVAEILGLLLYGLGFYKASTPMILLAVHVGLFLFLAPTLLGVAYRMIPFFCAQVLVSYQRPIQSPNAPLGFLGGMAAHFALILWHAPLALAVVDGALAAAAWHYLWLWFRRDVVREGLLLLLFIGFSWLGWAYVLYAVQDLNQAFGLFVLGRAPLHALGLGFALSLVIAMVTRVTRGHSGRTLQSDHVSWIALTGVQIATILRVAAAFPSVDRLATINLSAVAAPVVVLTFIPWAFRYSYMLLTPRLDGRPG